MSSLSEEELARTLGLTGAAFTQLATTFAQDPNATLEPQGLRAAPPSERVESGLVLGATIGEGGMGIVRGATQRSLGRRIAVKTLRPAVKDDRARLRLLREAWVTGVLEHPNIVPVYDLSLGEDGTPSLLLKLIEGFPWSQLLEDQATARAVFGVDDLLEWNLRILVQLCNAVSFAHSRGILHRDIKPDNVMVGRFGEVYLVDWGVAVSLRDDPTGRMPVVSQANEAAGTPAYMAPEMLGGSGKLGERTDVYLLGATLYEVLVGRPPHVGAGFREIVASILLSHVELPESVPPELAAIATRAMSASPEDRFGSADELRQRLEWYLRHRGSLAISAEATLRVEEMRGLLASDHAEAVRDRVHHLFAEARFGFRQAIGACDDNDAARLGLRQATELVVEFELAAHQPEAAAAALAELESPPARLAARVADAIRSRDAEKAHIASLERLRVDLDPETGRRTRIIVTLVLGTTWAIGLEVMGYLRVDDSPGDHPYWTVYATTAGFIAVAAAVWWRQGPENGVVSRRSWATVMLMFAMLLTLQVGAHLLGVGNTVLNAMHLYCWAFTSTVYALFIDRRFWPTVVVFFLAFFDACIVPAHGFHAMAAGAFALTLNSAGGWSRRPR